MSLILKIKLYITGINIIEKCTCIKISYFKLKKYFTIYFLSRAARYNDTYDVNQLLN